MRYLKKDHGNFFVKKNIYSTTETYRRQNRILISYIKNYFSKVYFSVKNGVEVDRINGVDPMKMSTCIDNLSRAGGDNEEDFIPSGTGETLNQQLHRLTHKSGIVLFMKGNANEPKCKFSRAVMELLTSVKPDIIEDSEFR